jgi:hypothetical protein
MAIRVQVREIDDAEGQRLLRIIRRSTGSVVTWRRDGTAVRAGHAGGVNHRDDRHQRDRVRDVIHNLNADGFDSLSPKYKGGRPKTLTLPKGCPVTLVTSGTILVWLV